MFCFVCVCLCVCICSLCCVVPMQNKSLFFIHSDIHTHTHTHTHTHVQHRRASWTQLRTVRDNLRSVQSGYITLSLLVPKGMGYNHFRYRRGHIWMGICQLPERRMVYSCGCAGDGWCFSASYLYSIWKHVSIYVKVYLFCVYFTLLRLSLSLSLSCSLRPFPIQAFFSYFPYRSHLYTQYVAVCACLVCLFVYLLIDCVCVIFTVLMRYPTSSSRYAWDHTNSHYIHIVT